MAEEQKMILVPKCQK